MSKSILDNPINITLPRDEKKASAHTKKKGKNRKKNTVPQRLLVE